MAGAAAQYLHAELLSAPGAAVDQLLQSVPVLGLSVRPLQLLLDVLLDLGVDEVSGFETLQDQTQARRVELLWVFLFFVERSS